MLVAKIFIVNLFWSLNSKKTNFMDFFSTMDYYIILDILEQKTEKKLITLSVWQFTSLINIVVSIAYIFSFNQWIFFSSSLLVSLAQLVCRTRQICQKSLGDSNKDE